MIETNLHRVIKGSYALTIVNKITEKTEAYAYYDDKQGKYDLVDEIDFTSGEQAISIGEILQALTREHKEAK